MRLSGMGEVIDDAEGGFAGEGESFGEVVAGAEIGVVINQATVLGAEIEVATEVKRVSGGASVRVVLAASWSVMRASRSSRESMPRR